MHQINPGCQGAAGRRRGHHLRSLARCAQVASLALGTLFGTGCTDSGSPPGERSGAAASAGLEASASADPSATNTTGCPNRTAARMPLFGDLHVHTSFSFDAAAISTGATPVDANRFARGEAIPFFPLDENGNPAGTTAIDRPLDFLAVTDHGEFLGERSLCATPGSPTYETQFCTNYRVNQRQGMMMLGTVITTETPARVPAVCEEDGSRCLDYAKAPWQLMQDAANTANAPCEFTSFIAYEYTGTPGTSNYHRNVIFRGDRVPDLPVSYVDAPLDSQLWARLDHRCNGDNGCDYLTIPHNTNLANGRMGPYRRLEPTRENKRAYAQTRLKREPIMEIFQHKGGSECINGLSSVLGAPDELCDQEAVRVIGEAKTYVTRNLNDGALATGTATEVTAECAPGTTGSNGMLGAGCVHASDFQRSALVLGLAEEQAIGLNPIKLGIIASTDTHAATPGATAESSWQGAVTGEATPAERLRPGLLTSGIDGNPGGLAGVWAEENTREAIFAAMQRREVFGTSGPRIVPRLFGGWRLDDNLCTAADAVDALARSSDAVPMGGDLEPNDAAVKPRFLAYAVQDPASLGLAELQLVKGWIAADGTLHTQVDTIAVAEPAAASLCTVYEDATYRPGQAAYYYLRVVEPPRPRWHTYDCAALPKDQSPAVCRNGEYPATVREMAWTSPIWIAAQTPTSLALR
ncbi:MAG: DUF3604 domain-containing protein [Pseudomonadota bacterium]